MEDHGSKNQYNAQYHTEPIAPFHVLRQTKICRNKSGKNHSNQRQNNALNTQPADSVCTAFTVPKLLLRWLISIMVFIRYHLSPSSSAETKNAEPCIHFSGLLALRLSVWLTKIFGFLTPHGDQECPPALRAKQRKVYKNRAVVHPNARFPLTPGADYPFFIRRHRRLQAVGRLLFRRYRATKDSDSRRFPP